MNAVEVPPRTRRPPGLPPSALAGGVAWLTAAVALRPSPFETAWAWLLLLLAALVLVPLGLRLVAPESAPGWPRQLWGLWGLAAFVPLPAALLLGGAFLLPQGMPAAALAVPWLATTALIALLGLGRVRHHRRGPLHELCVGAGLVYLAVGGFWALLDRAGVRPLDFEGVIVLLTAIHFHYAGFALPLLTGFALRETDGRVGRLAGVGVIAATPLVAVGITATQLGLGAVVEVGAAWLMAAAGALTAWMYLCLAARPGRPPLVRVLWGVAAVALAGGMVLAALYGARSFLSIDWLTIPWMRALHGTANALGLGLAGLLGWALVGRDQPGPATAP